MEITENGEGRAEVAVASELRDRLGHETCSCGYDLRATGHCGCGKYFSICLGCHLPTKLNRCTCAVKTRNPDYPEEWM